MCALDWDEEKSGGSGGENIDWAPLQPPLPRPSTLPLFQYASIMAIWSQCMTNKMERKKERKKQAEDKALTHTKLIKYEATKKKKKDTRTDNKMSI